jgi:hypothetical protein
MEDDKPLTVDMGELLQHLDSGRPTAEEKFFIGILILKENRECLDRAETIGQVVSGVQVEAAVQEWLTHNPCHKTYARRHGLWH